MLVGTANEEHLFAVVTQVTDVDVGGHIDAGEVSDMHGTVGVRKRGSNGVTFYIFHIINVLY